MLVKATWLHNITVEPEKLLEKGYLMNSRHSVMIALIMSVLPMGALADLKASLILENLDVPEAQTYLNGMAQAFTMANAYIDNQGFSPKIYCIPSDLTLTSALAGEALRYGYEKHGDTHPALLVMVGMSEMFPCE